MCTRCRRGRLPATGALIASRRMEREVRQECRPTGSPSATPTRKRSTIGGGPTVQAGLRAHEGNCRPIVTAPSHAVHAQWRDAVTESWMALNSFTVAGAAPGLPLDSRAHRLPVSLRRWKFARAPEVAHNLPAARACCQAPAAAGGGALRGRCIPGVPVGRQCVSPAATARRGIACTGTPRYFFPHRTALPCVSSAAAPLD